MSSLSVLSEDSKETIFDSVYSKQINEKLVPLVRERNELFSLVNSSAININGVITAIPSNDQQRLVEVIQEIEIVLYSTRSLIRAYTAAKPFCTTAALSKGCKLTACYCPIGLNPLAEAEDKAFPYDNIDDLYDFPDEKCKIIGGAIIKSNHCCQKGVLCWCFAKK